MINNNISFINDKYLAEKVAKLARQYAVENDIIDKDEHKLSINQLRKIVKFFGGKLEKVKEEEEKEFKFASIEKTGVNEFLIKYDDYANALHILHELGHAFLDLQNMKEKESRGYTGNEIIDNRADVFSREFLMPRRLFELVVIDNLSNQGCDVAGVAGKYDIGYTDALSRGVELNIWK